MNFAADNVLAKADTGNALANADTGNALETAEDWGNLEQARALKSDERSILSQSTVPVNMTASRVQNQRKVQLGRRPAASNSSTISDGLREIDSSLEQANDIEYMGSQYTRTPSVARQGRDQVVYAGRVFCPTCTERPDYLEYSYRDELNAIIMALHTGGEKLVL